MRDFIAPYPVFILYFYEKQTNNLILTIFD